MGGLLTRSAIFGIGFVYPAYNTFKTLEGRAPGSSSTSTDDARREWLTYWVVFSFFYVIEEWLEWLLCLVPAYFVIKLGFIIWLWAPQTKGCHYIYTKFVRPHLVEHENTIDEHLNNIGTSVVQLGTRQLQRGKEALPQLVRQVMAKTNAVTAFQNAAAAKKAQQENKPVNLADVQ